MAVAAWIEACSALLDTVLAGATGSIFEVLDPTASGRVGTLGVSEYDIHIWPIAQAIAATSTQRNPIAWAVSLSDSGPVVRATHLPAVHGV